MGFVRVDAGRAPRAVHSCSHTSTRSRREMRFRTASIAAAACRSRRQASTARVERPWSNRAMILSWNP